MKRKFLMLALLVLPWRAPAQSNGPVRLALISENDDARAAADVLTAQLSGDARIHLLERDEIVRVYREQGLSAANQDYLKLGQVLGADGLLLFNVVTTKTSTNLTARLIAVKPGVVLAEGSFPWPLKDTAEWAGSVTSYLGSFLPKLTVLVKDAIPISVVNLRAATQSAESVETERELKLLTIQRLSQERQFFVLERQRMQLLSEEKELKSDDSPFWNGSYLLEGVVDQNGYSKDTITIDARLTPSKGGMPLRFQVSGSRTNYSEAVNQLAAKVAELLKVNSTVKEWNATDEAKQFFDEAEWALRWGVYSEAQAAANSAWALGKQDEACASVRVNAYLADAKPAHPNELFELGSSYYKGEIGTENGTSWLIQDVLKTSHGNAMISLMSSNRFEYAIIKGQPDHVKFIRLVHALELYEAQLSLLQSGDPDACKEWRETGASLLESAGQWLRDYYLIKQARAEVDRQLEPARRLCRDITAALAAVPEANNDRLWDAVGGYGVFWCETPEEGVALYKKLFELHRFGAVRNHAVGGLFDLRPLVPMLAAWRTEDENRIPRVWQDLVAEMCASTNRQIRGNGYFILCAEADNGQKFMNSFSNSIQGISGDDKDMNADIFDLQDDRFSEFFMPLPWGTKPGWTTERVNSNTTPFSSRSPSNHPPPLKSPSSVNRPALASKPAGNTASALETKPTNIIEVIQCWEAVLPEAIRKEKYPTPNIPGPVPGSIVASCYREGNLWLETQFTSYNYLDGLRVMAPRVFFRLNLNTFQSEAITVDKQRYRPQESNPFGDSIRTFEVYSNCLYISSSDGIKRYSLATRMWEDLPVPVGGYAQITAFDRRIFLSSATAIVEMTPDGQTSKVLASTRRHPPLTVLDRMDGFFENRGSDLNSYKTFAPILPGPKGSIVTFLGGQFYLLAQGTSDWALWTEIPNGLEVVSPFSPEGLLILSSLDNVMRPIPACELYLAHTGSTNIECLFTLSPSRGEQHYMDEVGVHRKQPPPQWASPDGMRIDDCPVCLDGDTVWVLSCSPRKDLTLFHFLPGHVKPVSYRLRLAENWFPPAQIEATPQGIIFWKMGSGSVWLVPAADLLTNGRASPSNN